MHLLNLAGQLKAGKGLAIVAGFVQGDIENRKDKENADLVKSSNSQLCFKLCESVKKAKCYEPACY